MAAAGSQAEEALADTVHKNSGKYIALVEGSIPTGAGGAYCTIGGELRSISLVRSAAALPLRSPLEPVQPSAAFLRRDQIPPVHYPLPTPCRA